MAQARIPNFKPKTNDTNDRRISALENEIIRLEGELRFILTHLDKQNFDPDTWNKIGGDSNGSA